MVSWQSWENTNVGRRKVQCPECGKEIHAKRKYVQCTNPDCRFRFLGNDHLFKTSDDLYKEHREIFQVLDKMELEAKARFDNDVKTIRELKQKLKPLDKPKLKENKPKPIQQTVA